MSAKARRAVYELIGVAAAAFLVGLATGSVSLDPSQRIGLAVVALVVLVASETQVFRS